MRGIRLLLISGFLVAVLMNVNIGSYVDAQSSVTFEITEIGQVQTSGWAASVRVQDNTAYVTASEAGLYVIDISDPENPSVLSQYNESIDHIHGIHVDGDIAYLADYTGGLRIVNVSDPTNVTQIGLFHDGGEVGAFTIVDDLAFIADFEDGLEIVNISNPALPDEIVNYDTNLSFIFNVEIEGDLAYVSDFISGTESALKILNISDLSNIEEIAHYPIYGEVFSIEFVGDVAFMMCSYGGVKIFNISDPLSLTQIGGHYDGTHAVDMEFYEGYMIVVGDGLKILDISDLTNVTEIAQYSDSASASDITIVNDLIFVANADGGLVILQIGILPESTTTSATSSTTTTETSSTTPSSTTTTTTTNTIQSSIPIELVFVAIGVIGVLCLVIFMRFRK